MTARLAAFIAALIAAGGAATVAGADPDLPNIPPHRHFVQTDQGLSQVGPRVCDDPSLQRAFNQFHSNGHIAVPGSPGPGVPAPGLHNGRGGEIVPRGCSFVAP